MAWGFTGGPTERFVPGETSKKDFLTSMSNSTNKEKDEKEKAEDKMDSGK